MAEATEDAAAGGAASASLVAELLAVLKTPTGRQTWREMVLLLLSVFVVYNMNRGKLSFGKVPLHFRWLSGLRIFDPPALSELEKYAAAADSESRAAKGKQRKPRVGATADGEGGGKAERRRGKDKGGSGGQGKSSNDFTVPSSAAVVLPSRSLAPEDVDESYFENFLELQTVLVAGTVAVVAVAEVAAALVGYAPPPGFSAVWAWSSTTALFSWYIAAMLTWSYLADHAVACVSAWFTGFFTSSLMLALVPDDRFDFGVDAAHREFASSLKTFCKLLMLDVAAPSLRVVKLAMSASAGVVAMVLLYPQLKTAQCARTGSRRFADRAALRALFTAVDALPAVVLVSFLPGLSRRLFVEHAGLSDGAFETARHALLGAYALVRLAAFAQQVQCHLWLAEDEVLRRQMAPAHRVKASVIQQHAVYVRIWLSYVAVHILTPTAIVVSTVALYRLKSVTAAHPAAADAGNAATPQSLLGLFMLSPGIYTTALSFALWWVAVVSLVVSVASRVLIGDA